MSESLAEIDIEKPKLPDDWRWVKLGEVCEINPSKPKNFNRSNDAQTTFVPMAAVNEETGVITNSEVVPYKRVAKGYTYFQENDVLFAKITPCMQNGKHVIARNLIDRIGFGTTEFHVIRPSNEVLSEWIWYFIRQPYFLEEAIAFFTGAVGQQRVPDNFLAEYTIPIPPVSEQKRIATKIQELMQEVEQARSACQKQLEAVKALPSAYLQAVFKTTEADKWERKELGELFEFQQGIAMSPNRRQGVNQHPFLRTLNVLWGKIDLSTLDKMDFSDAEISKLSLKVGDVLMCEGGEVGRTAVWNGEIELCLHQNHVHRLRKFTDSVIPEFYMYWMQAAFQIFRLYGGKECNTTIPNLSIGKLKLFDVPFPPLPEQHRIATYLKEKMADVEKLRTACEKQLETINALPQAILRKAFSGKL